MTTQAQEKETLVLIKTSLGDITVKLYNDTPLHRDNFIKLINEGWYNNSPFHRVINNFMIQGGDPKGTGMGGSDENIKGEFASNGVENNLSHKRGVISMARGTSIYSASSGFFICDADAPHLDGDYAAFGYVVEGLFTVDAIADYAVGKTDSNGNLLEGYEQPKIEYIKVLDNYTRK